MNRGNARRGMKVHTTYSEYPNVKGIIVSIGYNWVLIRDEKGKEDRHPLLSVEEILGS